MNNGLFTLELFLNNSNLTFLAFFVQSWYHRVSKAANNKDASMGNRTHNTNHLRIRILITLTTQPPRHLLNRRSLNCTWIISVSIEHDFIRVDLQIGWMVRQTRLHWNGTRWCTGNGASIYGYWHIVQECPRQTKDQDPLFPIVLVQFLVPGVV